MTQIQLSPEPVLDGVSEEDRATVRNVIYVLHALKLCISWSVTPKDHGYEIVGMTDPKAATDFTLHDLDLIKRVDLLRVETVSVRTGPHVPVTLAVFVLRKSEPVVLEEQDVIVQIHRKRRFG